MCENEEIGVRAKVLMEANYLIKIIRPGLEP
jgi:hypothetical protein